MPLLHDVTILDAHGSAVPLAGLLEAGPAVVVWLRHYG